jgi:chaperonin GroES
MSTTPIIPLLDRVLLKPDEQQDTTSTGIILPPDTRKRSNSGTVVAIGDAVAKGTPLSPGDRIIYQRHAGLDMEWGGEKYLIVLAHEVIAKISTEDVPSILEPGER